MTLRPGKYEATVVAHGFDRSRNGSPRLWISVDIDDGFGTREEMVGFIYLTGKAMAMARPQLKALGLPLQKESEELSQLGDEISLVGNVCQVELKEDNYGMKIDWFGKYLPPPDKAELRQIGEQLRKAKKTATEEDVPPAEEKASPPIDLPAETEKAVAESDGEDIPF